MVALFTRAWIEIEYLHGGIFKPVVALFTRAWIEISKSACGGTLLMASPSSRGRGLKYIYHLLPPRRARVALFTRAWIEISTSSSKSMRAGVALFTRAWIEIYLSCAQSNRILVALFTRAWIEISTSSSKSMRAGKSPSSRGRGLKWFSLNKCKY